MPTFALPNGDRYKFPDNMTNDEIRHLILQKFPDPAVHRGILGQLWRGGEQGVVGGLMDIGPKIKGVTPQPMYPLMGLNPTLANISGALQYIPKERGDDPTETEKFVNEPSEGKAQSVGKFLGGMAPFLAMGPTGLVGDVAEAVGTKGATQIPHGLSLLLHGAAHKLGPLRFLVRPIANAIRDNPELAEWAGRNAPGIGRIAGAVGQSFESRGIPAIMGERQRERTPQKPGRYLNPTPKPREPERKRELEDIKYVGTKD